MRWPPPAPPPGPTRRPPAGRRMASGSAGRCGEPAAWPAWGAACTGTLQSVGYQKILFKAFLLCLNILNQKEGDKLWPSVPTIDVIISLYIALHCGPRGCSSRYQLYEHLFCMFWASNYRPTTGHNLVRSDLDFWLDSTPF